MMSLVRPPPRADFATKSQMYLGELRAIAAGGASIGNRHFDERKLWSVARHKEALVGAASLTKCAWCEKHFEWKRDLDVEHYRPKAAVTRWEDSPPLVTSVPPEQVIISDGYWWLAFDWNNYSLACAPCNQGWKRNLFPVRGARAPYGPGMEAHEVGLLLDPMSSFRTSDHFSWTELGEMRAVSDEGAATIITCGLNRPQLVELRRRVARNVLDELVALHRGFHDAHARQRHLRVLRELCATESEFAGMNRWWVERQVGWTWERLVDPTTTA
jgi:hypothetical protein